MWGRLAWADTGGGWCRLIAPAGRGAVRVRFWMEPGQEREETIPLKRLHVVPLSPHTRVFFESEVGWRPGRIREVDPLGGGYLVNVPHREPQVVPEQELFVLSLQARPDPAAMLAVRAGERQRLHERRRAAVDAFVTARNATAGIAGLVSASVRLYPHQVSAVRRVLLDPVQRYLLADEVGMGKTVEAAAIVRQCLLDDPTATADVVTPSHLLFQWRDELEKRFDSDMFGERLRLHDVSDLDEVLMKDSTLLAIDEAHHVVEAAPINSPAYERLAARAVRTPRLLLLSATPAFGNEEATLAMLHLLDPVAHPLSEREQFAEKVAQRTEYGRLVVRLRPGTARFFLQRAAKAARERFPDDPTVDAGVECLLAALAEDDAAATDLAVRQVAAHIAATYRLHHRVIRNRRITHPELFPRRTAWNSFCGWTGPALERVTHALEDWRDAAEVWAGGDAERELAVGRAFACWADAVAAGPDATPPAGLGFPDEERFRAEITARRCAEAGDLVRAQVDSAMAARDDLRRSLGKVAAARIVIFASSPMVAAEIRRRLRAEGLHAGAGMSAAQLAEVYAEFEGARTDRTLVCEPLVEEGANLQFAHGIVHADVPFDPGRVEQRVGRLDRLGRSHQGVRQSFVHPLPNDPVRDIWTPWIELLCDAFGVRHRSISDVQFVLGGLMAPVYRELARGNAPGLSDLAGSTGERLQRERELLDEQYALDEMSADDDATSAAWTRIQSWEAHADDRFGGPVSAWLRRGLELTVNDTDNPDCFRARWSTQHTAVPEYPWRWEMERGFGREVTFSRTVAVKTPGAALLRPGHPLIDDVERFTRWDDRGSVFATWRPVPGIQGSARFFRLCCVVEADRAVLAEELTGAALTAAARQADWRLPPRFIVQYLRYESFKEVSRPELLKILEARFDMDEDLVAASDERWQELVDLDVFGERAREVRAVSEAKLRASPAYQAVMDETALAIRELEVSRAQLQSRQRALAAEGGRDPGLDEELGLNAVIRRAIAKPSIWLDAVGFLVVEGQG